MALASSPKTLLVTASGDTEILGEDSPVGTYQITAMKLTPTDGTAVSLYVHDGDGTDLLGSAANKLDVDADGGGGNYEIDFSYNPDGWLHCKALVLNLSAARAVQAVVTFRHR